MGVGAICLTKSFAVRGNLLKIIALRKQVQALAAWVDKPTVTTRITITLAFALPISLAAQNAKSLAELDLSELAKVPIVSASRRVQSRTDSPRAVSVVTGEEIRRRNFRNVPEAVASLTGVFLQQTNYGGGSPIVRGMVGNRILLMVNGVRLNNGTYRLGPNQYLNFVDINTVERIEVMRGAGSVLYGSDAFGGVINVITKTAADPLQGAEISGAIRTRFSSADRSGAGRAEMAGAKGRVSLRAGFTEEGIGDLRAGAPIGLQNHTGYQQRGMDLSLRWAIAENKTLLATAGALKMRGVPRTDSLRSGTDLDHRWTAQGREFVTLLYTQTGVAKHVDSVQMTLAFNRPFEDLERVTAAAPTLRALQQDSVNTVTSGVQFTTLAGGRQTLTYGVETTFDKVRSRRNAWNRQSGVLTVLPGTYPDRSTFGVLSFYLQDEVSLTKHLDVVLGVRHDRVGIRSEVRDPLIGSQSIEASPAATNGSAHLLFRLTRGVSLVGGIAQGFRAPNIDDSSIIGGSGSRFEIPNDRLMPEHSFNREYGIRWQGKASQVSVVAFDDAYRDLIDRRPGTMRGLSFVDVNGNGLQDRGEPDVWQRQNISRARVRGLEVDGMILLAEGWTWSSGATWTRGTDVTLAVPLTRIPPVNGHSRLTWQARRWMWVEAAMIAGMDQKRLAPADKTDTRIGPNGTAGFGALHLRAGFSGRLLSGLSVSLENVTNQRYRFHGSGFDRPGINLVVGYSRPF